MSYIKTEWDNGDIITAEKLNNVESGIEGINVSYEKTTWETGDTITAEKLNNIETGIEEAGSSDFSTATVNVVSDAKVVEFYTEIDYDTSSAEQDIYNRNAMLIDNNNCFVDDIVTEGTESFNVHYSKGHYYITGPNVEAISISGNASLVSITFAGETFQTIKGVGDCTITIS